MLRLATVSLPSEPRRDPTERFTGRVAVVTGAASGIGAAIARGFAADGGAVVGGDIDGDGLASLGESPEHRRRALFLASDAAAYVTGVNLFVDGGWEQSAYPDLRALLAALTAEP